MKKTRHKFVTIFCAILVSTFVAGLLTPALAAEAAEEQLLVEGNVGRDPGINQPGAAGNINRRGIGR